MKKHFVAIAGNVGVGKSTLTALLAEKLGWEPFYEAVGDNPYLADFYRDMRRWSFHSQIFFLSRRLRHHRQLLDSPNSVVQDRSVYEDAEIFARNLYQQGHMSDRDYRSYRELYEVWSSSSLPQTWWSISKPPCPPCWSASPNEGATSSATSLPSTCNASTNSTTPGLRTSPFAPSSPSPPMTWTSSVSTET